MNRSGRFLKFQTASKKKTMARLEQTVLTARDERGISRRVRVQRITADQDDGVIRTTYIALDHEGKSYQAERSDDGTIVFNDSLGASHQWTLNS